MSSKSSVATKHKVFLVDDHAVVREGLKWIIERDESLEVCGEAEDGDEAMEKIKIAKPDIIIVDIALPGTSGLDLTKKIRALFPDVRILALSMYKESLYAERALRSGANGYIMKNDGGEKLMIALKRVLSGQSYVSDDFKEVLLQRLGNAGGTTAFSMDRLTNRELEVFRLIGLGYGSKEIAAELEISTKTVEAHRENIREKLSMLTNSELVQQAIHWVHSEHIPQ